MTVSFVSRARFAADRSLAVYARIGGDPITIITGFAALHDSVSAIHELAILRAVIAAVALLDSLLDMTVTAAS